MRLRKYCPPRGFSILCHPEAACRAAVGSMRPQGRFFLSADPRQLGAAEFQEDTGASESGTEKHAARMGFGDRSDDGGFPAFREGLQQRQRAFRRFGRHDGQQLSFAPTARFILYNLVCCFFPNL